MCVTLIPGLAAGLASGPVWGLDWHEIGTNSQCRYAESSEEVPLAYRIQELAYGGLSDETKAELERIAEEDERQRQGARAQKPKPKSTHPLPGTRLVREWKGQRHEVTATEGGFEYDGRRYKSLSAIAKAITGAHWSGPQFFGLRTPGKDGEQ